MPIENDADPFPADLLRAIVRESHGIQVQEVTLLGVSENHAYRLTGPLGERWFCRVHGDDPTYDVCLPGEFVLLDQLHAEEPGLAIRGIPTVDGACRVRFEHGGRRWLLVLFSWLPGEHRAKESVTRADMTAMGDSVARFHRAAGLLSKRPPRPVYDAACYGGSGSFFYREDFPLLVQDPDREPFLEVRRRLDAYVASSAAPDLAPIHFDLHLGNFLFHEGGASMIDFDECGYGYPLFDLGHILFALHDHPDHPGLEDALVAAYEAGSGVEIDRRELRMFQGVQAIAILRYFFRLYDRTNGATNWFGAVPGIARAVERLLG